jgi:hypothetical protein
MKKIILIASVLMLAACGAPQVEEAKTDCDSTAVCVDTCKKVVDTTAVADTTKK